VDKYITDNFTGSIDDLLNHCSNLDTSKVEEQVNTEEKEACIQIIMKELECNETEAEVIYNDLVAAEVKETVDKMVTEGLLYVSGHNEDGEPLFQLTELGKDVRNKLGDGK
jgi:hypothetical protein